MKTTPGERKAPPPQANERDTLESWLDFQRATLPLKCAGLDDAQPRLAAVEPSSMTLLGLVQHLTEVERNWFQRVFAGSDESRVHPEQQDGFVLAPGRGIDEALATWRAEVARSRAAIADASLHDCGTLSDAEAAHVGDKRVSLRWIMLHMIQEYARHNGHADLLRERLDGATGM
ncbi:hypothetical protein N566_11855 [Streptomycetaceae bacterium MP113-05]|nr:hypothetical protein N566_11855 [Streptomycetaceae bacterium MP113-05]